MKGEENFERLRAYLKSNIYFLILSTARFWRKIYTVLTASCKLNRHKILNVCKNRFSFRRIIDFSEGPGSGKVWGDFSYRLLLPLQVNWYPKNMEYAPVPVRALEEKICRIKREL